MPLDIYLVFNSPSAGYGILPTGETTNPTFAGAIEVESFDLGVENSINIGSTTGGQGAGKVTFNPFTITKKVDKSSPSLFQVEASGDHFQLATLFVRRPGSGSNLVFLRYEFKWRCCINHRA